MYTFRDMLSTPGHVLGPDELLTLPKIAAIAVPRERNLRLPKSVDAYGNLAAGVVAQGFPDDQNGLVPVARMRLFSEPHLLFEGRHPTPDEIIFLGANPKRAPTLGPRRFILATTVNIGGQVLYGEAEAIYLEHGAGFSKPSLLSFRDRWTDDLSELALWIAMDAEGFLSLIQISPEPGSPPWRQAALLLGGGKSKDIPAVWQQLFKFVAGLYCFNLDIRTNPDSRCNAVLHDIRHGPPDALLVWSRWLDRPHVYVEQYKAVRRDGLAEIIGSPNQAAPLNFYDDVFEVAWHLDTIANQLRVADEASPIKSWREAADRILALECDSFELTPQARESLAANSYPDPNRMFIHVKRLASFSIHYAEKSGSIGDRIEDVAIAFGIEIALRDDSLGERSITRGSKALSTIPHVKVDDNKAADKCGRIYFAIDPEELQIIVDHIGLHDY
jgi:hypothetical protein